MPRTARAQHHAQPSLFDQPQRITPEQLLQMARGLMEDPARDQMTSYHGVLAYLHLKHGNPRNEVFRVLYLDRKNRLIEDREMGHGTIDHVPVYPREVIRAALLNDACALILCHNHPSGDPTPSQADLAMTRQIKDACDLMGITLHDHIIVGTGREHSMRSAGEI